MTRRRVRSWTCRIVGAALCGLLGATAASAQTLADLPTWAQERRDPPKRALVIGVQDYARVPSLVTPRADRDLVARRLRALGFTVAAPQALNLGRDQMLDQIDAFLASLQPGDVAVVYFSGHGIERDGALYLAPSDAGPPAPEREGLELISLDFLLDELRRVGVGLAVVLLDACRTDPFSGAPAADVVLAAQADEVSADPASPETPGAPSSPRSEPVDLAKVDTPYSVLVGYAARAGQPAYSLQGVDDTAERGSLYTRVLAATLGRPGADLYEDLRDANQTVAIRTGNRQTPWIGAGAPPDFELRPSEAFRRREEEVWVMAASLLTPLREAGELADYLAYFPASGFSHAARRRLFALQQRDASLRAAWQALSSAASSDSFQRLAGALISRSLNLPDQGLIGVAANDLVVYDAPAGFLRRREALARLAEGAQVEILDTTLSNKASSVRVALGDGRVGYIDHVRSETVPVRATAAAAFAAASPGQAAGYAPTFDLTTASLALLRSNRARIEVDVAPPVPADADDAMAAAEARRLAYVRGLAVRRQLIDLGASGADVIVNISEPGRGVDAATIRIGELGGPR
ncbi:caspase family protein [Brevundimonas sp.]|uniref:caspase family protein n=1 Tax=Brevundimonas sp. TaxID=1871086 RepID=UPI002FDAF4C3